MDVHFAIWTHFAKNGNTAIPCITAVLPRKLSICKYGELPLPSRWLRGRGLRTWFMVQKPFHPQILHYPYHGIIREFRSPYRSIIRGTCTFIKKGFWAESCSQSKSWHNAWIFTSAASSFSLSCVPGFHAPTAPSFSFLGIRWMW